MDNFLCYLDVDLLDVNPENTILKMNFNFNLKDMPLAPEASIRLITTPRDLHHTAKSRIKRGST